MSDRLEGVLALPGGLARGTLRYDEAVITAIEAEPLGGGDASLLEEVRGGDGRIVLPGFIDPHVHGGGGGDTMDGPEGVRTLARFHLAHGTTTLLPTTITNPWADVVEALLGVKRVMEELEAARDADVRERVMPSIPGAHLEGPFISPDKLGAQPPSTVAPTPERIDELLALDALRVATVAPELEGALDAARRLTRAGVRVSVGHTAAGYEEARALVAVVRAEGGTAGFTHLFNAMSTLASRAPGTVGAALSDPEAFAELILDLHHVHEASFLAVLAAKPDRLLLVTDAIRACGMAEGETELGGQRVSVRGGAARLPSGSLAGSVLTLDAALRNAVKAGVPLATASRLASTTAARYLGLADRGSLEAGKRADLVVLDSDLEVRSVVAGGRRVGA